MSDTPKPLGHPFANTTEMLVHRQAELERELTAAQADADKWREEYNRMRRLIAKQNEDIEQTCGKALGYPWFKDDQKNFPGSTEEHGVCVGEHVAETIADELADAYAKAQAEIARLKAGGCARDQRTTQFCAEAVAVQEENAKLQERVKRLEQAGDSLAQEAVCYTADKHEHSAIAYCDLMTSVQEWTHAKDTQ